jgi:hypothetical protein
MTIEDRVKEHRQAVLLLMNEKESVKQGKGRSPGIARTKVLNRRIERATDKIGGHKWAIADLEAIREEINNHNH